MRTAPAAGNKPEYVHDGRVQYHVGGRNSPESAWAAPTIADPRVQPASLSGAWRLPIVGAMQDVIALYTERGEPGTRRPADTSPACSPSFGLDTRKVAVERNEEIVPRSIYAETSLASGDSLEIVHFIGGG